MTLKTLGRCFIVVAPIVAATSLLAGCGDPQPPPPPPTTTAVDAHAQQPSGGAVTCTGTLTWTYQLIAATGTAGKPGPITAQRTYSTPASNGVCDYSDGEFGLRPGTWKISVADVSCTEKMSPIVGNHNLTMNGCTFL